MSCPAHPVWKQYAINGHRVVLYAGTFEPYQGLDLLVEASQDVVCTYKDVRFLCAGGNDSQIGRMKLLARDHGVADHFIFPGTVAPEEVTQLFQVASILVSPRITGTNTPLKIYSYLRSGVPIVATRILSHTQVLSDEVALLVEPRPESLSNGLRRLLDDKQLSVQLAANALQLADRSYSRDAYYRKMGEVLSFLAAKSRSAT